MVTRCTELTCPHHGAANRAAYVPDPPYVRCRGNQLVCTHSHCQEAAAAEKDTGRIVSRDLSPAAADLAQREGWAAHARALRLWPGASEARECGWCAKTAVIAYTDVLGIDWCVACYHDTFLENWDPEPTRPIPPGVQDE